MLQRLARVRLATALWALGTALPVFPITIGLAWQDHLHKEAVARQHRIEAAALERYKDLAITGLTMQRDQVLARLVDTQAQLVDTQAQLDQAKAENADLKAENATLKLRTFSAFSVTSGTPTRGSVPLAGGNRFAAGYCTWYVFNLRPVPWMGNAIDWWWNARPYAAEGYVPRPGAIMVTRDSWYGHVALVTSVVGEAWWVREMNFTCGLWCEDIRLVRPGGSLVGFIY